MNRNPGQCRVLLGYVMLTLAAAVLCSAVAAGPSHLTRIDEKIWLYRPPAPGSNSLIVELQDGLLVVGAQHSNEAARRMLKEIGSVSSAAVRYLLLPHAQAVTAGGVDAFPDGTLVVASGRALKDLEDASYDFGGELRLLDNDGGWAATPRPFPDLALEAQATLTDPERPVVLIPYPMHYTAGDLIVRLPDQGITVAGGLLFPGQTPFTGNADVSRMISTLGALAREREDRFVPLRGPLMTASEVRDQRDALSWISGRVESGLSTTDTMETIATKVLSDEGLAQRFPIDDKLLPLLVDTILQQGYARRQKFNRPVPER